MTKYMYFLPLKIASLFLSRPQHHRLNVLVLIISRSSSSGASRTCVVPTYTGSSPHPAESATVLGGRRPGASTPHMRRETRNSSSCERTTRENTKLQRRSALFCTVSHTCRDINTTVKSKGPVQFAYAFTPRTYTVPAHTGTQVAINTSTSAHTQGTNINTDRLCVW